MQPKDCGVSKLRVVLDFMSTIQAGLEQGLEVRFKGAAAHFDCMTNICFKLISHLDLANVVVLQGRAF